MPSREIVICVSGDPGSGKTTQAKKLCSIIGAEYFSIGEIHRAMAQRLGISIRQLNERAESDATIDQALDEAFHRGVERASRPLIVDARMGWQRLPDSIKVRFICSAATAASRIYQDVTRSLENQTSLEQCLLDVTARRESERRRYRVRYGVNINDASNYNIVARTDEVSPDMMAVELSLLLQGEELHKRRLLSPPLYLFPTQLPVEGKHSSVTVTQNQDDFFVVGSHERLSWDLDRQSHLAYANIACEPVRARPILDLEILKAWEARFGFRYPYHPVISTDA